MKSFPYKLIVVSVMLLAFRASAQTDVLHLKSDVVDTIFGKSVADPYRWMENFSSDSVKQWLQEQKKITKAEQKQFNGRMMGAFSNIGINSAVAYVTDEKAGPWYFQMMHSSSPFNPSPVLYYRETREDEFDIAFNPNDIRGQTTYTISNWVLSDSGGLLAVALSAGGSDWREIRIRNLYKQKDLNDKIERVRFSKIVWWHDGFFYATYKAGGQFDALSNQLLYYHKLGDNQDNDKLIIAGVSDAAYGKLEFEKTSNGRYLIIKKYQKMANIWRYIVAYKDLSVGIGSEWNPIVQLPAKEEVFFDVIDYADSGFMIHTNYKAPHGRVLKASLAEANHFSVIIPAYEKVLKEVTYVHHQLVAKYFTVGEYQVCMFDTTGKMLHCIQFEPGIAVQGFEGKPDDNETVFYENTFYCPTIVNHYDFVTGKRENLEKTRITFNASDYITEVVNYESADGTVVSMYLTHKKGLKLKSNNPVILYGYGGFGVPVTPTFSYPNIAFFDNEGILAVPMIRGGGELGAEWHEGGKGINKQKSFDDFVAAAQYLIKEGYTSKEKLAIEGASNGGLLVAAVMTQHPELCKVVVARVGVYDMLRFPKFTGGKYWLDEYGNPDNKEDFNNLLSYSPLHNLKPGVDYPAALFITGKNDDRVPPFQTYKFLASLQECSGGTNPHILYFEDDAGHNGATNRSDKIDEEAFALAFIFTEMHLPLR